MQIRRLLDLSRESRSLFLFGPRQTGKTTLLRTTFPGAPYFDLLQGEVYYTLSSRPGAFREQLLALDLPASSPIIVDEIQKLPMLLDEIHSLIEERKWRFILTGSGARKLVRSGVNLLGGRARLKRLHPFVSAEIRDFDLSRVLSHGSLPSIYFSDSPREDLKAYCGTYLQREVADEGLVRAIGPFARFLRTAAMVNAELVNFEAVASDAGVPARTIREYFGILGDTLVGSMVEPFQAGKKRKAVSTSKFYFFDVGVANALLDRSVSEQDPDSLGKALEHFIHTELAARLDYVRDERPLTFWRSRSGDEVDFVVGDGLAIEVKATRTPNERHLKGLGKFQEETKLKRALLVCLASTARRIHGVDVLPVRDFLKRWWSGEFDG